MLKERLLSLDVFRGITIACMILVNDPGDWSNVYAPLLHAKWHGITPTDLVFPFFVFIMGVAISMSSRKEGAEKKSLLIKAFKRTAYLFLIGLFLNAFPEFDFASLRIPGVLQRIALVFIACLFLYHTLDLKKLIYASGILLVGYWILMMFIPVPGVGPSNLDPGTNLAAWIDSILLSGHMYRATVTWDPEGVLSTFPAIVTGILGMFSGKLLFGSENKNEALVKLFVNANILIGLALIWDLNFPINKSLWTSSYVLYAGGLAMNSFGILFWLLDVVKKRNKIIFPFQVFGMNAITVYVFAGIFSDLIGMIKIGGNSIHQLTLEGLQVFISEPKLASLIFALVFVSICYIPIWIMYKKGIFLKV